MIEMCDLLIRHASDPHALATDPVTQAAAQRWIEVLGEAASHVSDEIQAAHPEVPWRDIVGTRIILAQAYFHIDQDIIGHVINRDIPVLRNQLEAIADALGDEVSRVARQRRSAGPSKISSKRLANTGHYEPTRSGRSNSNSPARWHCPTPIGRFETDS